MTAARTSSARRALPFGRRALVALTVGAGMALTPLPALANSGGTTVATTTAAPAAAPTAAAQVAVDTALAQVGDPYVWAGAGPDSFDCSGLTQYAYAAAGISLPHSSSMQSGIGTPVSYDALQPGDLVFFYSPVSHVAMYIGNGQIVHAPYSGTTVQVAELAYMPDFAGARRLA
jgi:cell wall-associated NlpC family hydrolase